MKVEITDDGVFNKLSPKHLRNYLISKDWQCIKQIENTFSIWDIQAEEQKYRVWLPEDTELGDFSLAMARTIKTLAVFESRSQLDLLEDIDTLAIGDVVRVRTFDPQNKNSNSLPFEYGLSLMQRAKSLVIAGACASIEKKSLFPAKKHKKVDDYSKTLRLGQTERGSFITKIISPIAVDGINRMGSVFDINMNETPFERQSIVTMLKGLDALHNIASETTKRGHFYFEPFEEAVSEGVSVLLCDAVTGETCYQGYQQTDIDVAWFYNEIISKPSINKTHLSFEANMMQYIKEAANKFREKQPENLLIEGYIITLDRQELFGDGVITILQIDNTKKRRFKIRLCERDYKIATEAHRDGLFVECSGRITQEGRSSFINYPDNFRVIED
jgi:hypothetical protein